jgi:hypothetical protein
VTSEKCFGAMKQPDLRWFLLISIVIHTLFLWRWSLTPLCEPPAPSTLKTGLLSGPFYLSSEKPSPGRDKDSLVQGKPFAPLGKPSSQEKTDQPNPSIAAGEGTTAAGATVSPTTEGTSFPDGERLRLESEIHHLRAGHPQGRVERPPPRKGSPLAHKEHPEAVEKQLPLAQNPRPPAPPSPNHPYTVTVFTIPIMWNLTIMSLRE